MPAEERTEPATPKRREEVRKKGQVAKSPELSSSFMLLALFTVLGAAGVYCYNQLSELIKSSLTRISNPEITPVSAYSIFLNNLWTITKTVGPFFLAGIIIALVVNSVQVRFLFATQLLQPNWDRINPASGFKRLFSLRALFDTAKSIFKVGVIAYIAYGVFISNLPDILNLLGRDNKVLLLTIARIVFQIGLRTALALIALAIIDYIYQRYQFEKSIRMTKQEIREELRNTEGSPEMRAFIKQRQRAVARQRMMAEVPQADVVITNPTELAVAVKYERKMRAPKVIAKGARLIAQRIKSIAKEHDIPVVEDKPLAQLLFKSVEVGQEIPPTLYKAVAEILAFVYRLGKRRSREWA